MRRLATIAMLVAVLAVPALGQHGGSHVGFSGHAVSAPHGSFGGHFGGGFAGRGPVGMRPSPGPRTFAPRSGAVRFAPQYRAGLTRPVYRGNSFANRSRMGDGDRYRHQRPPYVSPYGYDYPYYYAAPVFTGYVDPWLFAPDDYNDSYGYDYGGDVPAPYREYGMQANAPADYQDEPAAAQMNTRRPYTPQSSSPGQDAHEDAVTVIFKDGRPPQQIHNYLLTASTLTVLDARYHQIPLADVNIAATEAANRAAGVEFRVPGAAR